MRERKEVQAVLRALEGGQPMFGLKIGQADALAGI